MELAIVNYSVKFSQTHETTRLIIRGMDTGDSALHADYRHGLGGWDPCRANVISGANILKSEVHLNNI
jgi:hypothetical protein